MTNNGTILNDSIAHLQHLQAFDLAVKKRFSELELDKLLIYLIDTVDASALPYLAEQFDVLGYKGFRLAHNEADQRAIIKKSIELHRFKGTLWAVEEAIKAIGYGDAIIEERVDHWSDFRITLDIATHQLSAAELADLIEMVNAYKNARSHLIDVSFTIAFTDDEIEVTDDEFTDGQASTDLDDITFGGEFRHNGVHLRDGSSNYNTDTDVLNITII